MPFTVSHAAAVLPFRKLNLVWSAFIIGSMAPDFPYIVGNTDYRAIGHHFPGIIEFTLPAALLALWRVVHAQLLRCATRGEQLPEVTHQSSVNQRPDDNQDIRLVWELHLRRARCNGVDGDQAILRRGRATRGRD